MNAKRCKKIRKALRAKGVDPREARYYVPKGPIKKVAVARDRKGRVILEENGKPKLIEFVHPGTAVLHPTCGRRFYQVAKEVFS